MSTAEAADVIERFQKAWKAFDDADDYYPAHIGAIGDAGDALCDEVVRLRERIAELERPPTTNADESEE